MTPDTAYHIAGCRSSGRAIDFNCARCAYLFDIGRLPR